MDYCVVEGSSRSVSARREGCEPRNALPEASRTRIEGILGRIRLLRRFFDGFDTEEGGLRIRVIMTHGRIDFDRAH
jgi:hypothetical protein